MLQQKETYTKRNDVVFHKRILNSVNGLIDFLDRKNNVSTVKQPTKYNQIESILKDYQKSFCGEWLRGCINNYELGTIDVVGLSITYASQLIPSLLIAKLIKDKKPDIKIVIGGTMTVHFKNEILNDKSLYQFIDYCIFYQGEDLLVKLLNELQVKDKCYIENIVSFNKNKIWYKENNSKTNKPQGIPNFDGIDLYKFPTPNIIIPILSSKGCYWSKCTYCSHYEGYGNVYYKFDADNVINTINLLKNKYEAEYFYFVDEALPYNLTKSIAEKLINDNLNIKWFGESRIDTGCYEIEDLKELKKSGCIFLINGIESGNSQVLEDMKKGININSVETYLKNCKEVGIGNLGMFFIGFPTETYDQAEDTFKFIEKNKDYLSYATIGIFTLERGTKVYEKYDEFGIEYIVDKDKEYQDSPLYKLKAETEVSTFKSKFNKLKELYSKYNTLEKKFESELNRESLIFLNQYKDESKEDICINNDDYIPIISHGKYKNKKGLINIYKNQLKILK